MNHASNVKRLWTDKYVRDRAFALWTAHLQWLGRCGFHRAHDVDTNPTIPANTGHEIVDLLAEYIAETGKVNAHLGLTSSDVIDNVRLMQVDASLAEIRAGVTRFNTEIQVRLASPEAAWTTGFTHWQPAAPVTWAKRVLAWTEPLDVLLASGPEIHAKAFGGPVGDAASLRLVLDAASLTVTPDAMEQNPFDWSIFGLSAPQNRFPIQSSDHLDEMAAVNWACAVAAQLHKIALDLRFLASRGTIKIGRRSGHAGSSSMPHKTNPFKWEKVCSICRSLSTTQAELWAVTAHNSLERTLDGSWQIKHALERCFHDLAYAIDEMRRVDFWVDEAASSAERIKFKDSLSSDTDLTRQVLRGGESRWSVYLRMLHYTNQQTKSKETTTT